MDIVGPMETTESGNSYLVTMIDKFSRYPMVIPVSNILSTTIARAIMRWISYFGPPDKIVSDNGKQFIGKVFQDLCNILKVKHVTTSIYHPQSNGAIERFHRWLKTRLRIIYLSNKNNNYFTRLNWDQYTDLLMYLYRRTPTAPTISSLLINGLKICVAPSSDNCIKPFNKAF